MAVITAVCTQYSARYHTAYKLYDNGYVLSIVRIYLILIAINTKTGNVYFSL